MFDIISGYKHKPIPPNSKMSVQELLDGGYILSEKQWLAVSPTLAWRVPALIQILSFFFSPLFSVSYSWSLLLVYLAWWARRCAICEVSGLW